MPENPPPQLVPTDPAAFETALVQPWLLGVNLNKPVDQLTPQECARLSNFVHSGGGLSVRPGLSAYIAGLGGSVHSIRRLTDPQNGLSRVFWGAGTSWYRGDDPPSAAADLLESGFSGDPLTFVPIRKPGESGSWMLVADRSKMRKAGLATTPSRPIGLPAPSTAATASTPTSYRAAVAAFDSSDGSQAANWQGFGGVDDSGKASGSAPTMADVPGVSGVDNAVAFTVVPGQATTGFRSCAVLPKALNLTSFAAGPAVTDDDLFHLFLRMSDPSNIREVRVYLVCSPLSATGSIPGTHPTENVAAFMHTFQPSDYEAFIGVQQSAEAAAGVGAASSAVQSTPLGKGRIRPPGAPITGTAVPRTPVPLAGQPGTQGSGGVNTWLEFSQIGLPVRRSDFVAIGTAGKPGTDWSTITGIYLVIWTRIQRTLVVSLDDCYFTGGAGPDTAEPGALKYDYRYINHDTQTGARSNMSPEMAVTAWVDSLRQPIRVVPAAGGNANYRQEFFRRGGSISDNWYFVGENSSDGGPFTDTADDAEALAADTGPTENFQPVPTVNGAGDAVLAQPVPVLFGPIGDGVYCALGDPYRPGHVYSCLPGNFDAWPASDTYIREVCSPSEELMNGCVLGGGGFVLSRERGYLIYTQPDGGITASPTGCTPGLAARWGFCVGPGGIYYVARDAVRVTGGSDSQILSDQIRPLFNGQTVNGRLPIDFAQPTEIRLACHNSDLWFSYVDVGGTRQKAVYSTIYKYWRFVDFQVGVTGGVYSDETINVASGQGPNRLLAGTVSSGIASHDGYTDLGVSIPASIRTGAETYGQARQDKLLGDLVVDADLAGVPAVVRTYFNAETVVSGNVVLPATSGRLAVPVQPFGPEPERARNLSIDVSLTAPFAARPVLYGLGAAVHLEPDQTQQRVTAWEPLPGGEGFLQGIRLDCDTFGAAKTVIVEAEVNGTPITVATLTVQTTLGTGPSTRHTRWFSWPAVHANLVRLRPTDENPWTVWRAEWLSSPLPPRIARWDTNEEDLGGDRYYTGIDLRADTFGLVKTLEFYVDHVLVGTFPLLTTGGQQYIHYTLTPGRGHLFRIKAVDDNPGLLYGYQWITTEEPREQGNWNAQFTTWSSLSDKYLKGLVIECDTFGAAKTVDIEADGVQVHQLTVNHNGRLVKNYTFPQIKGRVFRVIPEGSTPTRPYSILPLFDEEPYALSRWETQLLDFDLPGAGWGSVFSADLCYLSSVAATLTITGYNALGVLVSTASLALPSTSGAKQKRYFQVPANKGVLFKFVFQTDDDSPSLTLYQEESRLRVQQWAGGEVLLRPFGNSDIDRTRAMVSAVGAAARSGGGTE